MVGGNGIDRISDAARRDMDRVGSAGGNDVITSRTKTVGTQPAMVRAATILSGLTRVTMSTRTVRTSGVRGAREIE